MNNSHEPAFPFVGEHTNNADYSRYQANGLTKRELFAKDLMVAMTANPELLEVFTAIELRDKSAGEKVADKAIEWADVLLKQLEK